MYGTTDTAREDQKDLLKLDKMVTKTKKALNKIILISNGPDAYRIRNMRLIATETLLEIEKDK